MDWLSTGNSIETLRFGWMIGVASGLYAVALMTILIATAPAYHHSVPLSVSENVRKRSQKFLFCAQLLLFLGWALGWLHVSAEFRSCYVITVSLGALSVTVPFVLLFMFTTANWVGRASAR